MEVRGPAPQVFDVLAGEAEWIKDTPYGSVGLLYDGPDLRAEWVSKSGEAIDPGWFSQDVVDFIYVAAGQLRVEYEREDIASQTLHSGEVLILPAGLRCRAYRWPRGAADPTIFVAVYPVRGADSPETGS